MNEPFNIFDRGWIYRVRKPETGVSNRVIFLIHGWTGDENSMWAFSHLFPKDVWLIAPRGTIKTGLGGYGWVPTELTSLSSYNDMRKPAEIFIDHAKSIQNTFNINADSISLAGFSQGAALIYSICFTQSGLVQKAACLSGFIPRGMVNLEGFTKLARCDFLITHGTNDEIVPFSEAQYAEEALIKINAQVKFTADHTGHKLGPLGSRALRAFFE